MPLLAKEIAFSCYPVSDFARSLTFYRDTLGLKLLYVHNGDGMDWAEFDVGGAALCIAKMADWTPTAQGCTVALEVEDFDGAIAHLKAHNIPITFGPMDTGVCKLASISDPDGNSLMVHLRYGK